MRRAVAARFTTWRVPRPTTLSPVIRLSGHNPNQEAKWLSVFQRPISSPTSAKIVCATMTSIPSIRVRSTPATRCSSCSRLKCGAFLAGFLRLACACFGWSPPLHLCYRCSRYFWRHAGKTGKLLLQLLITLGNAFLVGVVGVHFLFQQEQQLRSPVALQALSNLLRAGLYARVSEFS